MLLLYLVSILTFYFKQNKLMSTHCKCKCISMQKKMTANLTQACIHFQMNLPLFLCLLLLATRAGAAHAPARTLTAPSDVSALASFVSAIDPATVPQWSCLATWNFSAADPCSLPRRAFFTCGLSCSYSHSARVAAITLDPAGYSGTLSPAVTALFELTVLDLSDNSFSGPIPSSLSSLTNLRTLVLRSNGISGTLPGSIATLVNLDTLDISYNSLSGMLPVGLGSLSGLSRLDLSFNKLTGPLPRMPQNLLELALKGNSLSGALPRGAFDGLTRLEVVELSQNSFTGTLEEWFFLLPSLQQVDLANNSLTGVQVPRINSRVGLVAIDLGFNQIDGYIPGNLTSLPQLSSLSMRHNKLRGGIPSELGRKKTLTRLFLDGNYLIGKPPKGLITTGAPLSGSLGDNCLQGCPASSRLCAPSQKPAAVCRQAYGGKSRS